jgi:hypothetical protein
LLRLSERAVFAAVFFRFAAAWYGRSSALGVGPLPAKRFLLFPPVPFEGPFLSLRIAPFREDCQPLLDTSFIHLMDHL